MESFFKNGTKRQKHFNMDIMIPEAWFYNATAGKFVSKLYKDLLKEEVTTNCYVVKPQTISTQLKGEKKNLKVWEFVIEAGGETSNAIIIYGFKTNSAAPISEDSKDVLWKTA